VEKDVKGEYLKTLALDFSIVIIAAIG